MAAQLQRPHIAQQPHRAARAFFAPYYLSCMGLSCMGLSCLGLPCLALLTVLAAAPVSAQQTLYVSDQVFVPLRTGQGTQYRIRMNLKTGQALTVQEQSEDAQWVHVVTEGDTDGWVQTQYLSKELPAQQQLESVLQKNRKLEEQLAQLKQQNRELENRSQELTQNVSSESQSRDALTQELDKIKQASANAIALDRQNQELATQNAALSAEKEKFARENAQLTLDQRHEFMLYSAGLILLGIVLAFIVPMLKPKKRHSEWR